MADSGFDEEAAALFALSPREFIAARDARVAALKKEKRAPLAGRLKLLRRPTVAAWCVNLLARAEPDELRALVDLGAELGQAQQDGDAAALRQLGRRRREMIGRLVTAAIREARDVSGTEPDSNVRFDVEGVLNAAMADPDVAERALAGRLERAESFAGFGPLPGLMAVPDRSAPTSTGPKTALRSDRPGDARQSAAAQRAERAEAERLARERAEQAAREAAEEAAREAAEVAARARADRDDARRARDVARHAQEEAAAVLAEAERQVTEAERRLTAAERTVAAEERALTRAERERDRLAAQPRSTGETVAFRPRIAGLPTKRPK
jgi:hypothetical protein